MKDELLPCPFCGGKAVFDTWEEHSYMLIRCKGCGTRGAYWSDKAKAIAAWNTRHLINPQLSRYEVSAND